MEHGRPEAPQSTKSNVDTTHAGKSSQDAAATPDARQIDDTYQPQSATKVFLLLVSVFLSIFLVALDRLIISTVCLPFLQATELRVLTNSGQAIPQITDEFHSLPDVGWYGSAYTLTCCSFQLLFGKLYTLYSVKVVMLTSVLLFELGSVVCGAAPSSTAFIVGRAIAGVGAAGIFAGCVSQPPPSLRPPSLLTHMLFQIVSMVYAVPLEKRPKLQGMFGALFGIASIVGPLIGGVFTSKLSWRWCFYINLPFGGVAMAVIALCLKVPDRDTTKIPWTQKLAQLDVLGSAALIPGVVCLLLALQWGGNTYAVSFPKHGLDFEPVY